MSLTELELEFHPLKHPPSKKVLQFFQQDAGWSISRRENEKLAGANSHIQWVSVDLNKASIGIARLELAPPEFCHLSDLTIKSKFRGRGVGRWFMRNIESYCSTLGIKRLLLVPEASNLAFYEALAFAPDPHVPKFLKKDINPFQRKMFSPSRSF